MRFYELPNTVVRYHWSVDITIGTKRKEGKNKNHYPSDSLSYSGSGRLVESP